MMLNDQLEWHTAGNQITDRDYQWKMTGSIFHSQIKMLEDPDRH